MAARIPKSIIIIAEAVIFFSSKATFNPIEPATWAMPAFDSMGEIFRIVFSCLWYFIAFWSCCFGNFSVGTLFFLNAVYLLLMMVAGYIIAEFLLERVVALLIVLMLVWLGLPGSPRMLIRFLYEIIFSSLVNLRVMFVGGMVDIKVYLIEVSSAVVFVIAISLWFHLRYPIVKREMLIGIIIYFLLAHPECSTDKNCGVGLYCQSCGQGTLGSRCVPLPIRDPFKLINNSLPFNKYAFLTTHNSYAINGRRVLTGYPRFTLTNQEDSITQQLNNGVRALMLDAYDFEGDIWLCHSHGGECYDFTAFGPAIDTMKEIEAFLSQNPSEIITLILEDYVQAPNGLTKLINDSGLSKYWFPLSNMPLNGQDWPLVSDMVANNQRLLVFTSIKSKQDTEGIAYQWNYMVENQHGDDGMHPGICSNRNESSPLRDKSKSLVLVNFFKKIPCKKESCMHHWRGLINMLHTCYGAAGERWANFVAVDYYKRSDEVPFQAVNTLNGKLLCGCDDVHACVESKAF